MTPQSAALAHVPLAPVRVTVALDKLDTIVGWKRLDPETQDVVREESIGVAKAVVNRGLAELAMGEHLSRIHDRLAPHRFMWLRYCKTFIKQSQRQTYRYIERYKNAAKHLPPPLLKAAMARGLKIVGDTPEEPMGYFTPVIKQLPPPDTDDPKDINDYLDRMEETFKERQRRSKSRTSSTKKERDPAESLVWLFRQGDSVLQELQGRAKTNMLRNVMGMWLTRCGIANPMSFDPIAVPDGFVAVRGRPRKLKAKSKRAKAETAGAA